MSLPDAPTVSVVIPSYNHAPYLVDCISSIQNQTLQDWELILIDDGSRDNSVEIARSLAATDPRIAVYSNEINLGTYGTEERALEMAGGAFVAVMNSDDLWAPDKLELQVNQLRADPKASFSYVLGAMIDSSGSVIPDDVHADWPRSDPQEPLPFLLYENRILASGVLFRRRGLRFEPSCRYSGDWVALLEQSARGHARTVGLPMTFWRQHETNTYRRSVKQMLEEIRVRKAIHQSRNRWFLRDIPSLEIRRGLAKNAMNLFALLVYFKDLRQARKYGWAALRDHADKKSALKRTLSGYLGAEFVRNYFWQAEDRAISAAEESQLIELLRTVEPLQFQA